MAHVCVPDIGEFRHVPVIEILVAVGDAVMKDQPLVTVESDKAVLEIPSPEAGMVAAIDVGVGDKVSAGSPLLSLELTRTGSECNVAPQQQAVVPQKHPESDRSVPPTATSGATTPGAVSDRRVYAGPTVRKLARDLGVDLHILEGSGPRGRIVAEDLRSYVRSAMPTGSRHDSQTISSSNPAGERPGQDPGPEPDFAQYGPIERRPLSHIQKISGARVYRSWVSIPHVTNHDEADVTDLEAFRAKINREHGQTGTRISPLPFAMKACIAALKAFPEFNASLENETVILKRYYHIGFAAGTPRGLVVPVIRDTDQKGVLQIANEMGALAASARIGKLSSADMQGGTFSISSLGSIGGTHFTPIINAPEVAILGLGRIQTRWVWSNGAPQSRLFLPLSLSWDHRVIDGAAAGRFNSYLAKALGDLRHLIL